MNLGYGYPCQNIKVLQTLPPLTHTQAHIRVSRWVGDRPRPEAGACEWGECGEREGRQKETCLLHRNKSASAFHVKWQKQVLMVLGFRLKAKHKKDSTKKEQKKCMKREAQTETERVKEQKWSLVSCRLAMATVAAAAAAATSMRLKVEKHI